MSYKADLQSNNVDLQSILATINALPEAGGGGGSGSIETCTVTISVGKVWNDDAEAYIAGSVYAMAVTIENGDRLIYEGYTGASITLTVEKSSLLAISPKDVSSGTRVTSISTSDGSEVLGRNNAIMGTMITGDCTITVSFD